MDINNFISHPLRKTSQDPVDCVRLGDFLIRNSESLVIDFRLSRVMVGHGV